jgi:hypothetical protein
MDTERDDVTIYISQWTVGSLEEETTWALRDVNAPLEEVRH